MPNFLPYRILSYVLLPIAFLIGVAALLGLPMAIANPAVLFPEFMMIALLIYTFCSLRFLHNGLLGMQPLKRGLKDWIKVNAYVAIVFGITTFLQSYQLLTHPATLAELSAKLTETQTMNPALFQRSMQIALYIMLIYSFLLLTHLFVTLVLVRRYDGLFSREKA